MHALLLATMAQAASEGEIGSAKIAADAAIRSAKAAADRLRPDEQARPSYWEQEPRKSRLTAAKEALDSASQAVRHAKDREDLVELRAAAERARQAEQRYRELYATYVETPPPSPPPPEPKPPAAPIEPKVITIQPRPIEPIPLERSSPLAAAADALIEGRYREAEAAALAVPVSPTEEATRHLLIAMAAFAVHQTEGGEEHLATARRAAAELRRLRPGWSPPPELCAPRLRAFLASAVP